MPDPLPPELIERCNSIMDEEVQGNPLTMIDYVAFVMATVLLPAILIVIGIVVI